MFYSHNKNCQITCPMTLQTWIVDDLGVSRVIDRIIHLYFFSMVAIVMDHISGSSVNIARKSPVRITPDMMQPTLLLEIMFNYNQASLIVHVPQIELGYVKHMVLY